MQKRIVMALVACCMFVLTATGFSGAEAVSWESMLAQARPIVKKITFEDLKGAAENSPLIILDVRDKDEFAQGSIPGALHIPRGHLEFRIAEFVKNPSVLIVVYCRTERRSLLAAKTLREMGYDAMFLAGGYALYAEKTKLHAGREKK